MIVINHRQHRYFSSQQGFMILEALVVMAVLMSLMSLGARSITKNAEKTVNQVTAQQLQQITQAAQHYVQDHYPSFKNNSNPTLTWKQLVEGGYLSSLIPDKNHYGQAYRFTVMKEQQGTVQLLLTTEGGLTINEQSLRQIAGRAGSSAGYASVLEPGKIIGTQRSWELEGTALSPGHLASLVLVNEQEVMDAATFLRRTQVAGHPEYNQMETDLLMIESAIRINKGQKSAILNEEGLNFAQGTSGNKIISIFNSQYPNLTIEDYTLTTPNTMKLDSANLNFTRAKKYMRIGVDYPRILVEDEELTWKTEITPAKIKLENLQSQNTSYVGNDKITLSDKNNNTTLNASNLSLNSQILIDKNFIKIPFYAVNDVKNPYDLHRVAEDMVGCDGKTIDVFGRLFVVGDTKSQDKYLCMCTWRPNNKHHTYIIINKNETAPKTDWPW